MLAPPTNAITMRLEGGLGNQLFQYAAGRAASLKLGVELHLDDRNCNPNSNRPYLLHHFGHAAKIARGNHLPPKAFRGLTGKILLKYWEARGYYILQRNPNLCRQLLQPKVGDYFSGFWQDERYFQDIANVLRKELQVITPPSEENKLILQEIKMTNSVALHVRRGDYISHPSNLNAFAACSPNYYIEAMKFLEVKIAGPLRYFVFSDDIIWVRLNIELPKNVVFVDINNDQTSYEDLRLMSNCAHNIIANSTFSWWGAWLNANVQKMVIAPRKWYLAENLSNEHINAETFTIIDN